MTLTMIFKTRCGGSFLEPWYKCRNWSVRQECGTVINGTELYQATMLEF